MGKTSKWIRSFLTGKKDKVKEKKEKQTEKCQADQPTTTFTENPTTPISIRPTTPNLPTTPKEKKRWSFRRSSASASGPKDSNSTEVIATTAPAVQSNENEQKKNARSSASASGPKDSNSTEVIATTAPAVQSNEQKKNAMAVAAATVVAADAAMAAAETAVAVIRLTETTNGGAIAVEKVAVEKVAAIKIQSVFRSYLARKALCALKGLVKLQALVRGHLVRKQATATLRCIQALVTVQARARAQRIRIAEEGKPVHQRQMAQRRTAQDDKFEHPYEPYEDIDRGMEENIKIVEMDLGESKGSSKSRYSYSNYPQSERAEHRFSTYYAAHHEYSKQNTSQISPALTDMSPRASSGHFEEYSFTTAQSSPQFHSAVSKPDPSKIHFAFPRPDYEETMSYDYPFFPNYMANTESSRAKVRSQSAPKQRPDSFERQPSRRRASLEGRNVPRAVRMQRSSSHVGSAVQGYHYPWSVKLDKSSVSLKESECGSTSTMLTNTNYCRSLVAYDPQGKRY